MNSTEQTITTGTQVKHYSKGYTATVTAVYYDFAHRVTMASLRCDVGITVCPLENLRVA